MKKLEGCLGVLVVLAGILVCVWLYSTSGLGRAIVENKPLFTIPLFVAPKPAQAAAASSYRVTGPPSLSAAFVNEVLAQAHSPAVGTGQALYDLGKRSGIDDAYALAFFKHESFYGTTGVARVTRSLGNIRCSPGYACIDGFRAYASWQAGYQDWYALIKTLYVNQWHRITVAQIIPLYAPKGDGGNNPATYITAVEQAVTVWRRGEVSV